MRERILKVGMSGIGLLAGVGLLVGCSQTPEMALTPKLSAADKARQESQGGAEAAAGPKEDARAAAGMPQKLFVDPTQQARLWAKKNADDARAKLIEEAIAKQPVAKWFGDWNKDVQAETREYVGAAARANSLPTLVAYNMYQRDCGSYSGGGAKSPAEYRTWITALAKGIGSDPALVILEPDSLAQIDCLPDAAAKQTRTDLVRYAVDQLATYAPHAWTYVDAANANWIPPATMADRLAAAGIEKARGFSVNVSNFYSTAESDSYAMAVRKALSASHGLTKSYVVDTSRNGNGSPGGEWCNPASTKLGTPPRAIGAGSPKDFELWVKAPGESDGTCGAAPDTQAGEFAPDLAYSLIQGH